MVEVLPIRILREEDGPIFGKEGVALGKLDRAGIPVASGLVITAPHLKLRVILEHHDFGSKEVFEQSLTLVKKEIEKIPIPEVLEREVGQHTHFWLADSQIKSVKKLWLSLLFIWIEEIKNRLWQDGFYQGITDGLESQTVIFVKKIEAWGNAYFDPIQDEVVVHIKQDKLHPNDLEKLQEMVRLANKKLFIPHQYDWILDKGLKIVGIKPFTPPFTSHLSDLVIPGMSTYPIQITPLHGNGMGKEAKRSVVKVFLDLSDGLIIEREADGVYIAAEKIFDLNKPRDSFEDLVFRVVEAAVTFPNSQILFKLADMSEGMGKVRGTLRLLHQKSLLEPLIEALDFVRNKKSLNNVHLVIPFVRGVGELVKIKQELSIKKLKRQASLQFWLEIAVPENIINLEDYLMVGIDGVVLNLDELIAHFNGFDQTQEDLVFYKNEVSGLLKFLEDSIKLLNKSKIPFIAYGSLSQYQKVLEFLVEKGVYGVVVERYEVPSAKDLLYQTEKRMILRKSS